MLRRDFLKSGVGLLGASLAIPGLIPLGHSAWAATGSPAPNAKRLIVVFLRGAVDGLSVVVPHGDPNYYAARNAIAIKRPGGADGALDLDGYFGLHPALSSLLPLWQQKQLAFVEASGSPDPTRSHFDAQSYMESGRPGVPSTSDGWMNRLLSTLPGARVPTEAVSFGPTMPKIFAGSMPVANVAIGQQAAKPTPFDRPQVAEAFGQLYDGNDAISRSFHQARASRQQLLEDMGADMTEEMRRADNGAPQPGVFPATAARMATMMARDPSIRLGFAALGGWDTHVNQGGAQGQLAGHLKPLGDGLAALARGLGPAFADTVVLVMSEFGRTVHEDGNGGTDHGHGNVMWVMGGPIRGGKIYGDWPGLATGSLYQGRDLAVTTDFRIAVATLLQRHLRLDDRALATIFPGMPKDGGKLAPLVAA